MNTTFDPPIWENPEIQGINRLPMRSPLLPYPSPGAALTDVIAGPELPAPHGNDLCVSLDGVWDFRLLDNPADDEKSAGNGGTITVPGAWTRQGYDKPHYTNVQMPFAEQPPGTPRHNPTGLYRRSFTLPDEWKARRTVLHLGSAESCAIIHINGMCAGVAKDTRLPSEFDISRYLRDGENEIRIKVVRYSDASYIEDQDQWWHGGIHRSVFLYSTAEKYIQDAKALPGEVTDDGGRLRLAITIGSTVTEGPDARAPLTIEYALYPYTLPVSREDAARYAAQLLADEPCAKGSMAFAAHYQQNSNTAEAELCIQNPGLWSHEDPRLYIMLVSIRGNGKHIESTAFMTGFRTVRIADRELRINGKMVYIKGVNRHEHDEKTGKTLSVAAMKKDIILLKTHNFNAVRTSHYPDDERWYELCDRYGIYLVDEANIENHAFYDQLCRDTAYSYAYSARVQRMFARDKNHPSVVIWSLGNESGIGSSHLMMSAWLHHEDAARPVNYEGAIRPPRGQGAYTAESIAGSKDCTDIIGVMYPDLEFLAQCADNGGEDHRPLIMLEYSHAMGNSNGGLADYWKLIESRRGLQGGFIWEWIDHGLEAFTPDGKKYWKYGGDFGDEPTDYDFVVDGLILPDQSLKPGMAECKHVHAPVRLTPVDGKPWTFKLENRYDFSRLDHLSFDWKLIWDNPAAILEGNGAETIIASGSAAAPDLAPGESADLSIAPPKGFCLQNHEGAIYIHWDITLKRDFPWANAGHVVARSERILKESAVSVCVENSVTLLTAGAVSAVEAIAGSFRPSLFRVPTQNDGLKTLMNRRREPYFMGRALFPWLDMDLLHVRTIDEKTETALLQNREAVKYRAVLLSGEGAAPEYRDRALGTYTTYLIKGDPVLGRPFVLDITFDLDPTLPELPRVGITAPVSAVYSGISWFGAGPHESYPDRIAGAFLGRYQSAIAEFETPYVLPQENGNRSLVRNLTLRNTGNAPGTTVGIWCDTPLNMSVSRYTRENMLASLHTFELLDTRTGPGGVFTLNIDAAQRGIGTATCGPDTRNEYRVRPGLYNFRIYLGGVHHAHSL